MERSINITIIITNFRYTRRPIALFCSSLPVPLPHVIASSIVLQLPTRVTCPLEKATV